MEREERLKFEFYKEINKLKALVYIDQNNIFRRFKKIDWVKFLFFLKEKYNLIRCTSFNAIDHKLESQKKFNQYLSTNGYRVEDPDISTMTNIDPMIVHQMYMDIVNFDHKVIIVVACDGGYSYQLDQLAKMGYRIHIIGAKDMTSPELIKIADEITYLDNIPEIILD